MPNPVELSVKSQLGKIITELEKIQKGAHDVNNTFKKMGDEVEENLKGNTKKVQTTLGDVRGFARRVADQIRGDFKTLLSLNAIKESLKLSEQFRGTIKESVTLSDTIRKLGRTFGIAQKDFISFQASMTKGLGNVGISSESASRTMEALVDTPVRGQEALMEYSKAAGALASLSGAPGSEGNIAQSIANVIKSQGGNVSDVAQVNAVASQLTKTFRATGIKPEKILSGMESIFTGMSEDLRKKMTTGQLMGISAAGQAAGPNATQFLTQFTNQSKAQRASLEARGIGDLFGPQGINIDALRKFSEEAKKISKSTGIDDMRIAMKAMGVEGDEAAEGAIRLVENIDAIAEAQNRLSKESGDFIKAMKEGRGLGEAWKANLNNVKSSFSEVFSTATGGLTDLLNKASESKVGSAIAVGGAATAAAMLAGFGMRGAAGGMLGGLATGKAYEAITGKEAAPVFVTNWPMGFGMTGGAAGGALAGAGMMALKAGAVGAAGFAGYKAGGLLNEVISEKTQGTTSEGFTGNVIERLFFKLDQLLGGESSARINQANKMIIELNQRDLKMSKQPSRGASQ